MRLLRVSAVALALSACATGMTERASRVRIVQPAMVQGYEFLGQVTGNSPLSGVARTAGYENALAELLDNAAALGATHVVLTGDRGPRYWTVSQNLRGEAFRQR
jgi:hypothetical protein